MGKYRYVTETRKRYVSTRQASEMTGGLLSVNTISTMVRDGKVPGAVKAGSRYFLPKAAIDALVIDMSNGLVGTLAPAPAAEPERPLTWHDRRGRSMFDQAVS